MFGESSSGQPAAAAAAAASIQLTSDITTSLKHGEGKFWAQLLQVVRSRYPRDASTHNDHVIVPSLLHRESANVRPSSYDETYECETKYGTSNGVIRFGCECERRRLLSMPCDVLGLSEKNPPQILMLFFFFQIATSFCRFGRIVCFPSVLVERKRVPCSAAPFQSACIVRIVWTDRVLCVGRSLQHS